MVCNGTSFENGWILRYQHLGHFFFWQGILRYQHLEKAEKTGNYFGIPCMPPNLTNRHHELPHQKKHEKIGKNGGWSVNQPNNQPAKQHPRIRADVPDEHQAGAETSSLEGSGSDSNEATQTSTGWLGDPGPANAAETP